ncbi:hypothetical protein MTO96_036345, partial [Rhipicephalus appendiculatus]
STRGGRVSRFRGGVLQRTGTLHFSGVRPLDYQQSAISNTIHEVPEAIITVSARRKLVGFSLTQATKDDAKTAFPRRGDIRGVLQCVDGTLVAIRKPEGLNLPDTASLMSRKECYALNVMLNVDPLENLPEKMP